MSTVSTFLTTTDVLTDEPIGGTTSKTTDSYFIGDSEVFSIHIIATSATGDVNLKIVYELSSDDENPTNWSTSMGLTEDVIVDNLTDNGIWKCSAIHPILGKWIRFKLTGISGTPVNASDVVVSMKLLLQGKKK